MSVLKEETEFKKVLNKTIAPSKIRESLLDNEYLSDVIFQLAVGEELRAHKMFLITSGPVFHKLFSDHKEDVIQIKLEWINKQTMLEVCRFIYSDILNLNETNMMEIFSAAVKLEMKYLLEKTIEFICKTLNVKTVFNVLQTNLKHKDFRLNMRCFEYIAKNPKKCLETEEFLDLPLEILKIMLQTCKLPNNLAKDAVLAWELRNKHEDIEELVLSLSLNEGLEAPDEKSVSHASPPDTAFNGTNQKENLPGNDTLNKDKKPEGVVASGGRNHDNSGQFPFSYPVNASRQKVFGFTFNGTNQKENLPGNDTLNKDKKPECVVASGERNHDNSGQFPFGYSVNASRPVFGFTFNGTSQKENLPGNDTINKDKKPEGVVASGGRNHDNSGQFPFGYSVNASRPVFGFTFNGTNQKENLPGNDTLNKDKKPEDGVASGGSNHDISGLFAIGYPVLHNNLPHHVTKEIVSFDQLFNNQTFQIAKKKQSVIAFDGPFNQKLFKVANLEIEIMSKDVIIQQIRFINDLENTDKEFEIWISEAFEHALSHTFNDKVSIEKLSGQFNNQYILPNKNIILKANRKYWIRVEFKEEKVRKTFTNFKVIGNFGVDRIKLILDETLKATAQIITSLTFADA